MKFSEKVQQQFIKAGWKEGRNVKEKYKKVYRLNEFPFFLKQFLYEYGDLIVLDCKPSESKVTNELQLTIAEAGYELEEDYQNDLKLFGKPLYPFAFFYPDSYRIACDEKGNVYMLGDYIFFRADNFKSGIEKLLFDDWSGSLELNEKTGEWSSDYKY